MPPVGSDNTCAMTLAVVRHGAQLVVLAVLAVIDITSSITNILLQLLLLLLPPSTATATYYN